MPVDADKALRRLAEIKRQLPAIANEALIVGAEAATAHAKATSAFHDRTGKTRQSIQRRGAFVHAGGASRFIQFGTRPHTIRPKSSKALRFVSGGEVLFRKWVKHPGTKAKPFLTEARNVGAAAALAFIRETLMRHGGRVV